jgi:L-ascorbate metabolism protein UlaG (beta-lactamase superfamily)
VSDDRIAYVGHSTVLLELTGTRFLTDPLLRGRVAHIRRHGPAPAVADLLPIDAVLISHAHADHLDVPSLRRVAAAAKVIVPRGCAGIVRRAGARNVKELDVGACCTIRGVAIQALRAVHDGRRVPWGRRYPALGFLFDGPTRVYFAGDTDLFPEMADLAGRVDVALLPVSGWGPRLPPGHLDPSSAAWATRLIRPAVAVPVHWGTMRSPGARGRDGYADALAFAEAVAALGVPTQVHVLMPGESMTLPVTA